MRNLLLGLVLLPLFTQCNDSVDHSNPERPKSVSVSKNDDQDLSRFPSEFLKVMDAHGGLDQWKKMRSLTYTIVDKMGGEEHLVDLQTRATLIQNQNYKLGYDGNRLWLQQDSLFIEPSRAEFKYNLMFYFYAMPFVLADPGINYHVEDPVTINGKLLSGIKIGYDNDIGNSPDDEYLMYYDPSTYRMTWLGYTVTYGLNDTSSSWHYIHYDKWQQVNGIMLPKIISWYEVKSNLPNGKKTSSVEFRNVDIDASPMDASTYEKPGRAAYINN